MNFCIIFGIIQATFVYIILFWCLLYIFVTKLDKKTKKLDLSEKLNAASCELEMKK